MGNKMLRIPSAEAATDDPLRFCETLLNMLCLMKAPPPAIQDFKQTIIKVSKCKNTNEYEKNVLSLLEQISTRFKKYRGKSSAFDKVLSTISNEGFLERLHYFTQEEGKQQLMNQKLRKEEVDPEDGFFLIVHEKCFIQSHRSQNVRKEEALDLLAQRLKQDSQQDLMKFKNQFCRLLKGNLHLIYEKSPKHLEYPLIFELCSSEHFRPDILKQLICTYEINLSKQGHRGNTVLHQLCQTHLIQELSSVQRRTKTQKQWWKKQNHSGETPEDVLGYFTMDPFNLIDKWNEIPGIMKDEAHQ